MHKPPHHQITEQDAAELKLDSYLMHIHRTKCVCGSHEKYCQMFEVWTHPTKTRTTGYRDLRPALRAVFPDRPISYINLPFRMIPICSDCVKTHKSAGGQPAIEAASAAAWAETLKRKYSTVPVETKVARSAGANVDKTIPAPTPDQL